MEFKALITRSITNADESIRINIDAKDTDFNKFRAKVLEAFKYTDYRANLQMQRLFEDTGLIAMLKEDEYSHAEQAAHLLYPMIALPKESELAVPGVAFEFAKLNAGGESLTLQVHFDNDLDYSYLNKAIKHVWELIDIRLNNTNKREQDHMDYIATLDTNTKLKVAMIMDILYGRATPEQVEQRLKSDEFQEALSELKDTTSDNSN